MEMTNTMQHWVQGVAAGTIQAEWGEQLWCRSGYRGLSHGEPILGLTQLAVESCASGNVTFTAVLTDADGFLYVLIADSHTRRLYEVVRPSEKAMGDDISRAFVAGLRWLRGRLIDAQAQVDREVTWEGDEFWWQQDATRALTYWYGGPTGMTHPSIRRWLVEHVTPKREDGQEVQCG